MLFHCLLVCLVLWTNANLDAPIVIERPLNRVDWDDVTLEYIPETAPDKNVTVNLRLTILSHRYLESENLLQSIVDLDEIWIDPRLQYHGVSEVPIPSHVRIWQPQTVVHNAVVDELKHRANFLSPNGTVRLAQRRSIQSVCELDHMGSPTCSLLFRSFTTGGGADIISYSAQSNQNFVSTHSFVVYYNSHTYSIAAVTLHNVTTHFQYTPFLYVHINDTIV